MRRMLVSLLSINLAGALAAGCSAPPPSEEYDQPFTSDVATLLDFDFDGQLTAASASNPKGLVRAQLLYTVGHLNGESSVAQLQKLKLTNLTTTAIGGGLYRVSYHAHLPVAWGSKVDLPSAYSLTLPLRADAAASFEAKYGATCNDGETGSVTVDNFWYHYRPRAGGCALAPADVLTAGATVRVSTENTVAKYPEYHKIWEDGRLQILAIFGKYAVTGKDHSDAGVSAFDEFVAAVRAEFPSATTFPANLPTDPGIDDQADDVTFELVRSDGTEIAITAILVSSVPTAGAAFNKRYGELATNADLVMYNGHAGLGANVRYLSTLGHWFPGKYQILFMDGCDTFAYVDDTIPKQRALLNPDDPTGTKYMDMVTNAMPAYFVSLAGSTMALVRALAAPTTPKSWGTIFRDVDAAQVAVVTGEEDNVFTPGYDPGASWNGLAGKGVVGYKQTMSWTTELLQPGTYVFATSAEPSNSSGDADLRVRVGAPPTITSTYKCRSYVANSNERCQLTLTAPGQVYLSVTGDSTALARFDVDGFQIQ
ncbi:MAG TPA: PPC domain-containing protein [Polyangia bacterium]